MYGTILTFIKFNNFGTWRLNRLRHSFHSFCCTIQRIFEPLRVYEPSFNTDKYGNYFAKFSVPLYFTGFVIGISEIKESNQDSTMILNHVDDVRPLHTNNYTTLFFINPKHAALQLTHA